MVVDLVLQKSVPLIREDLVTFYKRLTARQIFTLGPNLETDTQGRSTIREIVPRLRQNMEKWLLDQA